MVLQQDTKLNRGFLFVYLRIVISESRVSLFGTFIVIREVHVNQLFSPKNEGGLSAMHSANILRTFVCKTKRIGCFFPF